MLQIYDNFIKNHKDLCFSQIKNAHSPTKHEANLECVYNAYILKPYVYGIVALSHHDVLDNT